MKCEVLSVYFLILSQIPCVFTQVDSTFITKTEDRCLVGISLAHRHFQVDASSPTEEVASFKNEVWSLGGRLKYRRIGISVSLPISRLVVGDEGASKQFLFKLNAYPAKFLLESSLRYCQGFNIASYDADVFSPGMKLWQSNLAVTYPLNNQRFSLRSSFRFMDRQLKSCGSPLLSITGTHQNLHAHASSISFAKNKGEDLHQYQNTAFGLGAGYGFTWVQNAFFATTVGMANVELQRVKLTYDVTDKSLRIRPDITWRAALGYNADNLFLGLQAYHRFGTNNPNLFSANSENSSVGLTLGWRIPPPKTLQSLDHFLGNIF